MTHRTCRIGSIVALVVACGAAVVALYLAQERRLLLMDAIQFDVVVLQQFERPPQGLENTDWKRAVLVEIREEGETRREEWPVRDFSESPVGSRFSRYYDPTSTWTGMSADFIDVWGPTVVCASIAVTLFAVGVAGIRKCRAMNRGEPGARPNAAEPPPRSEASPQA